MGAWEDKDGFAARQAERRSDPRYSADEESVLLFVGYGATLEARLVNLSQEGCRIRTMEHIAVRSGLPVEVFFKVNRISFHFRGVLEWTDGHNLLGIRFVNIVPQRMVELANVICRMEETSDARAEKVNLLLAEQAATQPLAQPKAPPQPVGTHAGRERRQQARHEVDTTATILLVDIGSKLEGRIMDLSPTGCRIRTDERFPAGIYARVEMEFQIEGLPLRLGGVIQAIHDRRNIGIRFLDLSERRREQVLELIAEIDKLRTAQPAAAEGRA